MRKILALLLIISAWGVTCYAQVMRPAKWTYAVSKPEATVGEQVDLILTAAIDQDWYMYSSDLDPELGPTPTTFEFKPNGTYQLVGKIKPVGTKKKYVKIWDGEIIYFTGKAEFRQTVKILKPNPIIEGTSDYQVCTEERCIPLNEDFKFTQIKVSGTRPASPPAKTGKGSTAVNESTQPESSATVNTNHITPTPTERIRARQPTHATSKASSGKELVTAGSMDTSLVAFMVAAFLSGLLALLTPCVFPMIPMTVTFFTNQGGSRQKGLINAFVYGLSIVAIYTLIGTIVSRINGPAFANFISTHWLPNLFFFGVFIIFAMSFLGLFEIVLPSSLVNRVDAQSDRGGLYGIFFMAFTLALVSFSCTGPIVGSILVASAGGAVVKPILGMVAFSMAFAVPFTLFAIFPGWLKSLPKSGGWLNSVKVVLGFLELALALKFLSIADQVYHWRLLDRDVFLAFWIVIFALIGFYLLGKIRMPHDSETTTVSVPRAMLAIVTFAFVVYMIPGMFGAPLKGLAGYLPPQTTQDFDLTLQQSGNPSVATTMGTFGKPRHSEFLKLPHGLQGFFDYKEGLAYAKKVGKPVFIDFTGHGCVNCREMEARVWSDPQVLSRLQNDYVVLALYVDDKYELPPSDWYTSKYDGREKKTIGAQNADLQITRFDNNAQPYYCLLDHEGNLLLPPAAYELDVNKFVAFLDSGKNSFSIRIAQR